jgi:hypothetical protein
VQLKSKIYKEQYLDAFKAIKSQYNIDITILGMENINNSLTLKK